MKSTLTKLEGMIIIDPIVRQDNRGFFLESYHELNAQKAGITGHFVQENRSYSKKHVLRGLHGQKKKQQGKLIWVTRGEIWDVAVDFRPKSPTFGQFAAVHLSQENFKQVYLPPGFLHGFCVIGEEAEVQYKCTDYYDPIDEIGVRWNDPDLNIPWPIREPLLSEKDRNLPLFRDAKNLI